MTAEDVPNLEPAQLEDLRAYERLISGYGERLGLIAPDDLERVWDRHIADSLRGLACLSPRDRHIADLGSGAGLPGIPVAIARPDAVVLLVEPKARRAGFLELVKEELGLANVRVAAVTASDVSERVDACLARAFGRPETTWKIGSRLLKPRGRLIYYAGRSWDESSQARLGTVGAKARVCAVARSSWQGPIVVMTANSGEIGHV